MVGPRSFFAIRSPYFSGSIIRSKRAIRIFFVLPRSCAFLALSVMRPGLNFSPRGSHRTTSFAPPAKQPVGYAMEKPVSAKKTNPAAAPTPTLEERRATNAKEFERLHGVEEQLRLRKRDLLHSDTEGNRLYASNCVIQRRTGQSYRGKERARQRQIVRARLVTTGPLTANYSQTE